MPLCQSTQVLRGMKFQVTWGGYGFFTQDTWELECEVRVFVL